MDLPNPTSNLERENTYLRQRNAQLQDDNTALSAEVARQRQMLDRLHAGAGKAFTDQAGA